MTVKRGHTVVKIYKTPSNDCDQFTVVHYLGTVRQRKTFSDLGLAITEAETVASKLSQGELNVLELRNEDRLSYVRSIEALKPFGVPLEMAVMQFVEAVKLLDGASVVEAARYYAKHQPHKIPRKTVGEVIDDLIKAKQADRLSDVYIRDLRGRLKRFREKFNGNIGLVTVGEVEAFLRDLKSEEKAANGKIVMRSMSAKSRNNYRTAVGTLFYFAEARGYVTKGAVDVESIAVAREKATDIEIFRPEEMERILAAAEQKPGLIPYLAIGAFAGLRTAEIQRLDWAEVRLDDRFIEVKASKAKTASRRLVPITRNLKAWLVPHKKATGPVCDYVTLSHQLGRLTDAVNDAWSKEKEPGKFEWKHNALRHSFISYRVADIQNVAQVALEAGNSPRMVFSNYRELVRPVDAKKWFAITPASVTAAKAEWEKHSKIITLPKAAAA